MQKIVLVIIVISWFGCSNPPEEIQLPESDFCSKIHRNDSISLTGQLASVEEQMRTQTGVFVLEDGGTSMVSRAWLSEYAEKTIDIQYFIFSTDNVGLIACDYLVRAADRGVQVRILVDDIMVEAELEEVLALNFHENINIKIYNPGVNLGKTVGQKIKKFLTDFQSANQRMHNKTFIVDNKVVITGGRNIADEYFDYDHEYNFRDRDVLLLGTVTDTISTSFEKYWTSSLSVPVEELKEDAKFEMDAPTTFEVLHEYACNPDNFWPQVREQIEQLPQAFQTIVESGDLVWLDDVQFIADEPGKNGEELNIDGGGITTRALIKLVNNASKSVDIQTPYLITTDLGKNLFRNAIVRGVKVRILTNSLASTDNLEAFAAYQQDRKGLLEAGIRVFEFKPDAEIRMQRMTGELHQDSTNLPIFGLHAKTMVIDGETTVIGTFNLDPRSANLNTECITVIQSEQIAAGVMKGMEEEFQPENAWEVTPDFNPDKTVGVKKRIKAWTRKALPKEIL